jgi:hypothetical protein
MAPSRLSFVLEMEVEAPRSPADFKSVQALIQQMAANNPGAKSGSPPSFW